MPLTEIRVAGYRSVRELRVELSPVNVLTGPNGCGKSNLYNSLLADRASRARAICARYGRRRRAPSVFWAGPEVVRYTRKKPPKRVILGFESEEYGYRMEAGLPAFNSLPIGHDVQPGS